MKKIFCIIIFCIYFNNSYALETKIIYNIQNEIITNVDIKNEYKYLLALNSNLKKLDKEKVFNISTQSIIREKIKKIEILKNFPNLEINKGYTDTLLKNIYISLNFKSVEEFELYLRPYNLNIRDIRKKLTIDALWNELIIRKYKSKIEIDEEKLRVKIQKKSKNESVKYNLSEIVYEVKDKKNIEEKYQEIKKSIVEIGFENSASIYSISETSKVGGNIGWIQEESLNKNILANITKINLNEITKPIIISNGILILKIKKIQKIKKEINYDEELKKLINYERNRQLNQYSKIYFNKVKRNIGFNE